MQEADGEHDGVISARANSRLCQIGHEWIDPVSTLVETHMEHEELIVTLDYALCSGDVESMRG